MLYSNTMKYRADKGASTKSDCIFVCVNCITSQSIYVYNRMRPRQGKGNRIWSRSEWLRRKFCSDKCQRQYVLSNGSPKITRSTDPCKLCNKPTPRQNNYFCSMKCKVIAQDNGVSTENEKSRKSTAYKNWRKAVFERDNYTCQDCGQIGGYLHADHIKQFAFFKELRFNIDNGRTLCVDCHKKTPTYGSRATILSVGREA